MARISYFLALHKFLASGLDTVECHASSANGDNRCKTLIKDEPICTGRLLLLSNPVLLPGEDTLESLLGLLYCPTHGPMADSNASFKAHLRSWKSEIERLRNQLKREYAPSTPESLTDSPAGPSATPPLPGTPVRKRRKASAQGARNARSRNEPVSHGLPTPPLSPEETGGRQPSDTIRNTQSRRSPQQRIAEVDDRSEMGERSEPAQEALHGRHSSTSLPISSDDMHDTTLAGDSGTITPTRENLDQEENSLVAVDPRSSWWIHRNIIDQATARLSKSDARVGFLYVMQSMHYTKETVVKVGWAMCPAERVKKLSMPCNKLKLRVVSEVRREPTRRVQRAESLAHAFLKDFKWTVDCPCGTNAIHEGLNEYFRLQWKLAEEVIDLTTALANVLYRNDGELVGFWRTALQKFRASQVDSDETIHGRIKRWRDWLKVEEDNLAQSERHALRSFALTPSSLLASFVVLGFALLLVPFVRIPVFSILLFSTIHAIHVLVIGIVLPFTRRIIFKARSKMESSLVAAGAYFNGSEE